ncbi:Modulator of apoptosis 1 [Labeo rohita]|uniref:Modulator of apoptosis 1 n=1 Tax=Labeo rohita TaxID=84645 RepID=A0ABQ8L0W0_LABRO|nr:Modulator of apoptosis 1 [Labeo rohita]
MDLCKRFDVHGQNCLYVTGVEKTCSIEDITGFFEVHGEISKVVRVPDEPEQPSGRLLIQYSSESSILKIDPDSLGDLTSPKDPAVAWHVRTVRDMSQEKLGRGLAQRYLDELSTIPGSGRAAFLLALQKELQRVQLHSSDLQAAEAGPHTTVHSPHDSGRTNVEFNPAESNVAQATVPNFSPSYVPQSPVHIDESMFNPPQIQKVVVEHVIRNESSHSPLRQSRIRTFSGRIPKPNGEGDYETWRTQVDLLLSDPSSSDSQKVRIILESLLSPAADIVKPLGVNSSPSSYLNQTESDFAISRGGASAVDSRKHLLRQFCRGCWDQTMIIGLQLERLKDHPPPFSELRLSVRTEEDKRAAKLDRMKKHLGSAKAAAHAHSMYGIPVNVEPQSEPSLKCQKGETQKLKGEITALKKQVAYLSKKGETKECEVECVRNSKEDAVTGKCLVASSNATSDSNPMPRPWFCFKCGENGHIAGRCSKEPNPELARKKNFTFTAVKPQGSCNK